MNYQLIAFCGRMGSGKDTYGSVLDGMLKENGYQKVDHFSFAAPLRKEIEYILGLYKNGESSSRIANLINVSEIDLIPLLELFDDELEGNLNFTVYQRSDRIRSMLQYWGTDVRRKENENYWTNKAREYILNKLREGFTVYVTDCRFENEMDLVKELSGYLIVLQCGEKERIRRIINRDNIVPDENTLNHASEIHCQTYPHYDLILDTEVIQEHDIQSVLSNFFIN